MLRLPEVTRNLPLLICLEATVAHSSRAKQPSAAKQVAQHGRFYDPCSLKEPGPKARGRKESRAIYIVHPGSLQNEGACSEYINHYTIVHGPDCSSLESTDLELDHSPWPLNSVQLEQLYRAALRHQTHVHIHTLTHTRAHTHTDRERDPLRDVCVRGNDISL